MESQKSLNSNDLSKLSKDSKKQSKSRKTLDPTVPDAVSLTKSPAHRVVNSELLLPSAIDALETAAEKDPLLSLEKTRIAKSIEPKDAGKMEASKSKQPQVEVAESIPASTTKPSVTSKKTQEEADLREAIAVQAADSKRSSSIVTRSQFKKSETVENEHLNEKPAASTEKPAASTKKSERGTKSKGKSSKEKSVAAHSKGKSAKSQTGKEASVSKSQAMSKKGLKRLNPDFEDAVVGEVKGAATQSRKKSVKKSEQKSVRKADD